MKNRLGERAQRVHTNKISDKTFVRRGGYLPEESRKLVRVLPSPSICERRLGRRKGSGWETGELTDLF